MHRAIRNGKEERDRERERERERALLVHCKKSSPRGCFATHLLLPMWKDQFLLQLATSDQSMLMTPYQGLVNSVVSLHQHCQILHLLRVDG